MRAAMLSLALLAGLAIPLDEAVGLSSCEKKCHGNSACLGGCKAAQKRPPPPDKARQAAPAPASGASGWRDRAFTTEGGAGGY